MVEIVYGEVFLYGEYCAEIAKRRLFCQNFRFVFPNHHQWLQREQKKRIYRRRKEARRKPMARERKERKILLHKLFLPPVLAMTFEDQSQNFYQYMYTYKMTF